MEIACSADDSVSANSPLPSRRVRHGMSDLNWYSGAMVGIGEFCSGMLVNPIVGRALAVTPLAVRLVGSMPLADTLLPAKANAAPARPPASTARRETNLSSTSWNVRLSELLLPMSSESMLIAMMFFPRGSLYLGCG